MKVKNLSKHFGKLKPVKVDSSSAVSSFEEDGKTYFIKRDGSGRKLEEAEVFSSFVLQKLGVENCVKYEFGAVSAGNYGSVCESFITPDVKYQKSFFDMLMIYKFNGKLDSKYSILEEKMLDQEMLDENPGMYLNSVEFVDKIMREICDNHNINYDSELMRDRLNQMAICDYFMANEDRNMSNIEFLFKEKDGKLTCELAPNFDFAYCFGIRHCKSYETRFISHFGISEIGQKSVEYTKSRLFKDGGIIVGDIMDLAKQDDKYAILVDKFMNLDMQTTVREFEKEYILRFKPEERELIYKTFNDRIEKYNLFQSRIDAKIKKHKQPLEK